MRLEQINQNSSPNLLRETIFERIRLEEYPNRPSRFRSIFVCSHLESAEEFKKVGRRFDILYEVEPSDMSSNLFEADWSLITSPLNKTIIQVEEEARKYWGGSISHDNKKETIIDSDIRILRRIEI
jgi:hypothetical protein